MAKQSLFKGVKFSWPKPMKVKEEKLAWVKPATVRKVKFPIVKI